MEFSWTVDQEEFYNRILAFARAKLNNSLLEREQNHRFGLDEWRLCGEYGLLGLCVPEQYGGIGLDAVTTARIVEAFGRGCEDGGLVFSASAHLFACIMPIVEHASEEIKAYYVPRLCAGEWIGANAITEAEAGSDVFALKAKAVRDGDDYLITGAKSYVTNGPVAQVFLVYASTNPAHGHMGVSGFIVERDSPGLTIGKPFGKMGLTTSPICQVYFDDCRVPASHMIGREGEGGNIFKGSMQWERACLFAGYLGAMERQLERVVEYARDRRQFRKPIGKNQAISHRIANMKMRLEAARLLLYHACWSMDQQKDSVLAVSMSKLAISEAAIQSALDAIQIYGGNGFMVENGIERALRDAIPGTIFSGTSEIQRDLIAMKLGL
jgi:L-prolyl-PCP dehydrogenase